MTPHPAPDLPRLLFDLGDAGIELAPHPDDPERLRHRPKAIPPALADRLRLHRAAVRALLVDVYTPAPSTEAEYVLGERLGIAEGLGMPTHPGSPAWLIAVGCAWAAGGAYCPTTNGDDHGEVLD